MSGLPIELARTDPNRPALIAGPTASGKSALALRLAVSQGRRVVNADALQVQQAWRVLTARPTQADEAAAPHALYGHVGWGAPYSVGTWLREVRPLLRARPAPVIVGGTGLFLTALTEGLVEMPPTDDAVRAEGDALLRASGLPVMVADLDTRTRERIDTANPARVQRAWEVLKQTGRGLADWQDETGPPDLPLRKAAAFLIDAPKEQLDPRIEGRFDAMLEAGAIEEAEAVLPFWNERVPGAKAIGASELIAHLRGEMTLDDARERAIVATRRYATRQRTWFRSRMTEWRRIPMIPSDAR